MPKRDSSVERWRSIPGYEGVYEVSSFGRVRVLLACPRFPAGRIMASRKHGQGYRMVSLWDREKKTYVHRLIHRLVLLVFRGPNEKGEEGCHKDGNKENNRLENLRWGTRSSNDRDRLLHGWSLKLKLKDVRKIRKLYAKGGISQESLGKQFGVSQVMIGNIVRGENWKV